MMFTRSKLMAGIGVLTLALAACSSESVSGHKAGTGAASATPSAAVSADPDIVAKSQKLVDDALGKGGGFTPPTGGPRAQKDGASIIYIGSDLTNGGINAAAEGVKEAAGAIGWKVTIQNGNGTAQGRTEALSQAIASHPAGIILGGFDAKEQAAIIKKANDAKIPVVAWHGGDKAGPLVENGVFNNVTTDPIEVSTLAAAYVVADSKGTAGVALYTDRQYEVAVAKSDAIESYIKRCAGCSVLAYENSPIGEADARMPSLVAGQLQQFGSKLTYLVGINGNYFGGAQSALRAAGLPGDGSPKSVAAGDGDQAEFQRIRNRDYQAATVAEPINLQGWQLVDELNRALAGEQPSTFVAKPGLIVASNAPEKGIFDPDSGYREIYKSNWGK